MKHNDLELSQLIAAEILSVIVLQGLRKNTRSIHDLSGGLLEQVDNQLFENVMSWLVEEGVIRHGELLPDTEDPTLAYFSQTRLTSLGFSILQQKSPITETNEQFGKSVKRISDQKNLSQVGDLIGGILGGFTKSISS